jgi:hypothetical protein
MEHLPRALSFPMLQHQCHLRRSEGKVSTFVTFWIMHNASTQKVTDFSFLQSMIASWTVRAKEHSAMPEYIRPKLSTVATIC